MEAIARNPFDPVYLNAPWFFNGVFMLGCWGMMMGVFFLFEKYTRSFRKRVAEHPDGYFTINGMRVTPVAFEIAVNQLARIGRFCTLVGVALIVIGVAGAVWRE